MEAKIKSIYNKLKMKPPEWIPEIDKEIFKVGKQEGIREVVEWLEENKKWEEEHYSGATTGCPNSTGGIIPLTSTYYLISKDKLQAKLREWEIDAS